MKNSARLQRSRRKIPTTATGGKPTAAGIFQAKTQVGINIHPAVGDNQLAKDQVGVGQTTIDNCFNSF